MPKRSSSPAVIAYHNDSAVIAPKIQKSFSRIRLSELSVAGIQIDLFLFVQNLFPIDSFV